MKRVGLLIAYKNPNYGTMLQAFATQYIVESLGCETEIIDYTADRFNKHYPLDLGLFRFLIDAYQEKKKKAARTKFNDATFQNNIAKRKTSYVEFIHRRLHNIKEVSGFSNLCKLGSEYDAVLIGSDQKWHPGFSFGVDSSFRFVPKSVRTISYATSLGVSEYPKSYWRTSRKAWSRIDYLSVREKTGADIISKVCDNNIHAEVVVDPTYLISCEDWKKIFPVEKKFEDKYIFCYFLGNDEESKKCARRYANLKGLKLVSVVSNESYSEIDQEYADFLMTGESPDSFVNWIRGAECVFTDSFPGTAFSIMTEKQIYVFYRKNTGVKLQRHSRIDDILSLWEIKYRLITDKHREWDSYQEQPIDYTLVTQKVQSERERSMKFLKAALTF